ncbi:MAG: thiamine diphosphokinase [Coriobacteriia bacterium]|nr:thiamine diphosphokinase [Coriobacteriia bacterium]
MTTALLVSGSPAPADPAHLKDLAQQVDFILAVDSGADALLAAGLTPDLLLGDFDSIDPTTLERFQNGGVELQSYDPHKDATDIELALTAALELGYTSLIATRVLGGRIDHTLAALGCLARVAEQGAAVIIRESAETCVFLSASSLHTSLRIEAATEPRPAFVSLIPWAGEATVSITGVKWELDHATLTPASSLGVSNVPTGPHVDIEVHAGTVIVVLE